MESADVEVIYLDGSAECFSCLSCDRDDFGNFVFSISATQVKSINQASIKRIDFYLQPKQ